MSSPIDNFLTGQIVKLYGQDVVREVAMRPVDRLGEFVAAERQRLGISQSRLAELSGVAKGTVSMLEAGQLLNPPKPSTLRKLAKGLRVDFEVLDRLSSEEGGSQPVSPHPHKLKLLEGGIDGRYEPTEEELKTIQQAEEEDVWFGILSQPGFWDDPPDERRSTFRYLEGLIDEARRFKKRQATK